MRRRPNLARVGVGLVVALVAVALFRTESATAQTPAVVVSEVVAANDTQVDDFGETSDWFELRNDGVIAVDLTGYSLTDSDGNLWSLPTGTVLGAGDHLQIWASGRNLAGPPLHVNFSLKRTGETITLSDAAGVAVDTLTYPPVTDDQAYGRDPGGEIGFLVSPTPGASNTGLLPSQVEILTPAQPFVGQLQVELSGTPAAGEAIRYTTDGSPVTAASPTYGGPVTLTTSTVIRAAIVGNGLVGPEVQQGYTAIASNIVDFTSDLPIVLVHPTAPVGTTDQDAIVTIIPPDADGRAGLFDAPDYAGFAGLRIRGATSSQFPKKQYKFETWGDQLGNEVDADLLGLGADSDWGLYAPGYFDRAMINNPFMYELADRVGLESLGYRFVELYIAVDENDIVGSADYQGLYILRETIKIDEQRVDITEHTPTSAGPDGGYIIRYDWDDTCCSNIEDHPQFGSKIEVDSPGRDRISQSQLDWIRSWWNQLQAAAATDFASADQFIDFDPFIDHWLLEILALDVDILRASHYMVKPANGQLRGGPLWDYDRALGGADQRVDELAEARAWKPNGASGHSYESDIYADLWNLPEVQARLRARWAELRQGVLSDAQLSALINTMGAEIAEAYTREDGKWGGVFGYGSRFGGLSGELAHLDQWLGERTAWLDEQFAPTSNPPLVTNPGPVTVDENVAFSIAVDATDDEPISFAATGLPPDVDIDTESGLISGIVAYGDAETYPLTVTVTDSTGASTVIDFDLIVESAFVGPAALALNEYNAVLPGGLLADGGTDATLGRVSGNGGDWFEIVTIDDRLDLRGWRFDLWSRSEAGSMLQTASLVLADDPLLGSIRAGTLITVTESFGDDVSYDPEADDWTLQLQANSAGDGALFANQSGFDTNHREWRLVVRDPNGVVRAAIAGETEPWDRLNLGVSNAEVLAMSADPAAALDPATDYVDVTNSTFGQPNVVNGVTQNFDGLRPQIVTGDATCDETSNLADSVAMVQYAVGGRTGVDSCVGFDPVNMVLLTPETDMNDDGQFNLLDAVIITQCAVGSTRPECD